MRQIIRNAYICQINENDEVQPVFGDIEFDAGKIKAVLPRSSRSFAPLKPQSPDDSKEIDAQGRMLTLPQVNFHEHIYSRLAKGLPIIGPMNNFVEILNSLWWKLDRCLDLPMVRASAQMAALESLTHGVTYLFDHHASPKSVTGSLQTIADVLQDFKIRSVLAFEVSDRNGAQIARQSVEENLIFTTRDNNADVKGMMGLHALFTLSDETLKYIAEKIEGLKIGIHIHVAEDAADVRINRQKYGKSIADRLRQFGLLNERSLLVHGVHLLPQDYRIIQESGAAVVYNPDSNLNNAVGLPDFAAVPETVPVLLGTDGMHANVGKSLKQLFLLRRHQGATFEETFRWMQKIHKDQLRFVRQYFPDFTRLQPGDRADFVLWDYVPPTPLTEENFWGHYLYGLLETTPTAVFQAGQDVLQEARKRLQSNNELLDKIRKQGHRLFEIFTQD